MQSSVPSNQSYQLVINILADLVKEAMASYDTSDDRKSNSAANAAQK
ncbi:hypothetical protein [Paenibacillus pinistramenti]|nr:hypothetical protein [Paenibacillus pinistramenti]